MACAVNTIEAPEYWASALLNGDYSGLTDIEREHVKAWRKRENVRAVLSCGDESRFTWSYQLYYPETEACGGSVLDFVCEVEP